MNREMEWSPHDAMKAYLQTLHLCKADNNHSPVHGGNGSRRSINQEEGINIIESQGLELISAMAAGNQAKVLVEIISSPNQQGMLTPLTIALAVAAKQTGGKLICILSTSTHDDNDIRRIKDQLSLYGLNDGVIELRVGDPYEQIKDVKNIDFAVVDCKLVDHSHHRLRLFKCLQRLHLNPKGGIIIANNILHRRQSVDLVDQVLKDKSGVESSVTTLPLGSSGGIQVIIRIKSMTPPPSPRRRYNRFLVTFDA